MQRKLNHINIKLFYNIVGWAEILNEQCGERERENQTNKPTTKHGKTVGWTMVFFPKAHAHIETVLFLINILDGWMWKFVEHHMCFPLQLEADKTNSSQR